MTNRSKFIAIGSVAALASTVFAAQTARQLVIDGRPVGGPVIQQDGHYFIPIDVVAKFFGYTASVSDSQIALNRNVTAPAAGGYDSGVGSGSAMINQTSYLSTGARGAVEPTKIASTVGQSASVDGFDFTVTEIRNAGASYKQTHDQRGQTTRARYKGDSLVVVTIRETNRGSVPMPAVILDPTNVTVFDSDQVGYGATSLDARQSVDLSSPNISTDILLQSAGAPRLMLGPGGSLEFAVVASVPEGATIDNVMIDVPARGSSGATGARLMVKSG